MWSIRKRMWSSNFRERFLPNWSTIVTHFTVVGCTFWEEGKVFFRYYRFFSYALYDLALHARYFFKSPYHISKSYWKKQGADNIYVYGETPLATMDQIARQCRLLSHDRLVELGCGRGRSSLWLAYFVGCEIYGVDVIAPFIERAAFLEKRLANLHFINADMLQLPLEKATVIYFYGSSYSDSFIEKMVERFRTVPSGTKIITVSYPLTDFCKEPFFRVVKQFTAKYPWGSADIFLHIVETSDRAPVR